jgi:heat shock protein HslJ
MARRTRGACIVSALAFMAFMGGGCGGGQQKSSVAAEVHHLWHRAFEGVSIRQAGKEAPFFEAPEDLVMVFRKRRGSGRSVNWHINCNFYGTSLHVSGNELLPLEVGSTFMACYPRKYMKEDAWLARFMEANPWFHLAGDRLTLTAGGKKVELRERDR